MTQQSLYGPVDDAIWQAAKNIKLLICDVDGVFSDGRIYLGNQGEELKAFHTRDGYGVKALLSVGIEVAVITGRQSNIVQQRMQQLGLSEIHQGVEDKLSVYQALVSRMHLRREDVAYIGDDLVDLEVMAEVGLAVAVADAHPLVLKACEYHTSLPGGRGAVRELSDLILQSQGKLAQATGLSV
ncbi:3-deoxy-manno-octulosonate-8-phosphatase KdsC [Paraferrimonas sedimenticola]|uniref:3-deoxy-D-manno-octulosonate 8-phosphate phosphatase KdsC n=1 Tax=Paraferrimonas sedimenticola TaxID=375674 RepID=A0AA37RW37_9GAMM|nr:3-deoxy-manno-octulosonate-8-phosphatase KdsC [Paraferrimonas sedimenticola]GLP95827.1 3-deoxy-D-manno-octulosonate 8-phosphate phosphatase [Paraferrimonas sedimenticola]